MTPEAIDIPAIRPFEDPGLYALNPGAQQVL